MTKVVTSKYELLVLQSGFNIDGGSRWLLKIDGGHKWNWRVRVRNPDKFTRLMNENRHANIALPWSDVVRQKHVYFLAISGWKIRERQQFLDKLERLLLLGMILATDLDESLVVDFYLELC